MGSDSQDPRFASADEGSGIYRCPDPEAIPFVICDTSGIIVNVASLRVSDATFSEAIHTLSESERKRWREIPNPERSRAFVIARWQVRRTLAGVMETAPENIVLSETRMGKPVLADEATHAVRFNVSHSDELVAVAVTRDRAVGIDIERRRPVPNWRALAHRVLNQDERSLIDRKLSEGIDGELAFLQEWCRVEATIKAYGYGLAALDVRRNGELPEQERVTIVSLRDVRPDVRETLVSPHFGAVALAPSINPGADS